METNKALVLNERGHHYFALLCFCFFFCFFGFKKFSSIKIQACTVIILDSGLLVMSSLCAFNPQDEDWWPPF